MPPPNTQLKAWRVAHGWTLEEAARHLGTTKTSLYRWESGIHATPKDIEILAHLLRDRKNIRTVEDFLWKDLDI